MFIVTNKSKDRRGGGRRTGGSLKFIMKRQSESEREYLYMSVGVMRDENLNLHVSHTLG